MFHSRATFCIIAVMLIGPNHFSSLEAAPSSQWNDWSLRHSSYDMTGTRSVQTINSEFDDQPHYRYSHSIHKDSFGRLVSNGGNMLWMSGDVPETIEGLNLDTNTSILFNSIRYEFQATNPQTGNALLLISTSNYTGAYDSDVDELDAFTGELRRSYKMSKGFWRVNADGSKLLNGRHEDVSLFDISRPIDPEEAPVVVCRVRNVMNTFRDFVAVFAPSGNIIVALANNSVNEYAPTCQRDYYNRTGVTCNCQLIASHLVNIPNFNVSRVTVDALGTLAMVDSAAQKLYFQPTRSNIQPTLVDINAYSAQDYAYKLVLTYGSSNFVVPASDKRIDIYSLYQPGEPWPPTPASQPQPPPNFIHYEFDDVRNLTHGSYERIGASRDPDEPDHLYAVGYDDNYVNVIDLPTGSLLHQLEPSSESLRSCGIDTMYMIRLSNIVPGRNSLFCFGRVNWLDPSVKLSQSFIQLNSTTGDCIKAWPIPTNGWVSDEFAVDEVNQHIVFFAVLNTSLPHVVRALQMDNGQIVATSPPLFDEACYDYCRCLLQFHPLTNDLLVSVSQRQWKNRLSRLSSQSLEVIEQLPLPRSARIWRLDSFGSMLLLHGPVVNSVSNLLPYVFSYVAPNGSTYAPLTPPSALGYQYDSNYIYFGSRLTTTLAGDVIMLPIFSGPYRLTRFRPKTVPQPYTSSSSTSTPFASSSTIPPLSSTAPATSTTGGSSGDRGTGVASSTVSTGTSHGVPSTVSSSSSSLRSSSATPVSSTTPSSSMPDLHSSTGAVFSSSQSTAANSISATPSSSTGSRSDDISLSSNDLSVGTVVGIVIAVTAAVVSCVMVLYVALVRFQRRASIKRTQESSFLHGSDSQSYLDYAETQEMSNLVHTDKPSWRSNW